jgi:CHAT domain-containing protein
MVLDEMAARDRPATSPAVESTGLKQAAESLPGGAALVAYVEYRSLRPGRDGSAERYLAFVMRPGAPPAVVPLGSASRIDALVRDWHVEAGTDPRVDPSRRGLDRYREAGRLLREAIWDPLASHVGDRDYVFIVPDGAIHLVSLAALPAAGDRYLIEGAARLHYLSAERDLAVAHGSRDWGHGVLAIGGADFDAAPDVTQVPDREATPACRTFESMRFDPLPGSKDEAEEVASLWRSRGDVQILAGSGAREAAFKLLAPGRRILHLATHGYSLQGPCLSELAQPGAPGTGDVVGDNPLLLSGLALAGANRRGEGIEDGILTAKEIGALDLSGVEWAVLSGCDTGTGTVVQGEGVLGLRRAFQVAGAATLIMSLWPVDDGAARLWMRHLYEARLAGKSTVASVNDASLEMLHEQRRLRRSTHPYYWGAFVAAGDWR